ncbi:isochorismatase family cysteine hydrolase [Candidatus Hecatella orcuttiae]|uniref:cysteine hydrolase family protein n=1 Tax=Candidatus Hecatella orcuttiae TaxID=1935119 RepID=UPI002867B84D|nr:isochorismatase family cysteine hydrolase [Candidatus Hecatella orcuttiae]
MAKAALIVIDMLNDFVKGALKCPRAQRIIPQIRKLIRAARKKGVKVIYANDAHLPAVDAEFDVWGAHAVKGTKGAEVIDELKPQKGDFVIEKRRYSGFFETDLDILLRELKVDRVILTGLHTNCCVKHTAADAMFRGYKIIIPEDGVEAFSEEDHRSGLEYLKKFYKASVMSTREVLEEMG